MHVTRRTTTTYRVGRKGFTTKDGAYYHAAREEIGSLRFADARDRAVAIRERAAEMQREDEAA